MPNDFYDNIFVAGNRLHRRDIGTPCISLGIETLEASSDEK